MKQARDLQFEYIRIIATLWIVGVWHMPNFVDVSNLLPAMDELGYVTTCMLATFMFISGYFLSKYTFNTKAEILSFYKKRLTRFFPLFFISAILLYRLGINPDPLQLLFTLTGLSSYFGHQSATIWFISLLFSLYMCTPLISWLLGKINMIFLKLFSVVAFSIVFIYALSCSPFDYDYRITYTMPFYGLGLVLGRETIIKDLSSKWYVMFFSGALLVVLHYTRIRGISFLYIDTVVAMMLFFCLCYWLSHFFHAVKIISMLSYATMAMYLFHRPIFHLANKYILDTDVCEIHQFYFILMPLMIILSYFIQLTYDFCVNKFNEKKS